MKGFQRVAASFLQDPREPELDLKVYLMK